MLARSTGSGWAKVAELVDPNGQTGDKFGTSVCIHDGIVFAGSQYADVNGLNDTGAIAFFESDCPGIVQGAYMKPFTECNISADPGYHVPNDGKLWSTQVPCNGGKWQNLTGQTTCNTCPAGKVTPTPGAFTSEADCKAPFPAFVTLGYTGGLTYRPPTHTPSSTRSTEPGVRKLADLAEI